MKSIMINFILFGPPGSGKGTYSKKIVEDLGLIHISTGDLLRSEIEKKTDLGMQAKSKMEKGEFVPDETVISMIEGILCENDLAKGFVFDGFPRTVAQAQAFDTMLHKYNQSIRQVIAFEVEEEELISRIMARGKESGRADDQNYDVIKNRIAVYHSKTEPVKEYYKAQKKLSVVINEGKIDEVYAKVSSILSV